MLLKVAIAITMLAQAPAGAPAWDVAAQWICKTEKSRHCSAGVAQCGLEPGQAIFQIDFGAGTFKSLGVEDEFVEKIIGRKVHSGRYSTEAAESFLDSGDKIAIALKPSGGVLGTTKARAFVMSRADLQGQSLYYGTCYPA